MARCFWALSVLEGAVGRKFEFFARCVSSGRVSMMSVMNLGCGTFVCARAFALVEIALQSTLEAGSFCPFECRTMLMLVG